MTDDKEANKLFEQVSKAMQEQDTLKVSELLAQEAPEEEPLDEDIPADENEPEVEEVEDDEEIPHEQDEEDTSEEDEDSAGDKADNEEDDSLKELREQLAALKKENQSLKSQAGRVPHVQRKLDEIDKKLKQLQASPSSQPSAKITPKVDELLKDVEDTDPALAKAIRESLTTAIDGFDEQQRSREIEHLKALREEEQKAYYEAEAERLLEMYPNAPEVFASPHWAEWKKKQPKHILDLAQSDSADAVALAFDLYAKAMQEEYPELAPVKSESEKANKVEQERQRKQHKAANLSRSNVPAKGKEPTNPDALFAKYSEQIRKDLTGT